MLLETNPPNEQDLVLAGCRMLNTRPKHQTQALNKEIQRLGGEVILFPTLTIRPLMPTWFNQLPSLHSFHAALFLSANAVTHFFNACSTLNWPQTLTTVAIGAATARQLQKHHIQINTIPECSTSESLLTLPVFQKPQHQSILIVKGRGGRELIAQTLRQQQANVLELDVYERTLPPLPLSTQTWHNQPIDIILFTSEQGMENLFIILGKHQHHWIQHTPCLVISQRLAESAARLGIIEIFVTTPQTIVQGLIQAYTRKKS